MFWLVSSALLFIGSMWHLKATYVRVRVSYVAAPICLKEFPREKCAPLSRGGPLLERGAYLLRGGDLSPLLSC
jgi:hypothetical protein